VTELEKIHALNVDDRAIRRRLVAAYLAVGRTADAEKLLAAALKKNPRDTDALLGRSSLLLASGDLSRAAEDLNRVIEQDFTSAEAYYLLASLHRLRGNKNSSRQALGEAVRMNAEFLAARIELSRVLLDTDPKASLDVASQAPSWQKREPVWIAQRNWALLATGDKAGFARGVAEGIAMARSPDLLLQDAVVKLQNRDVQAARVVLEESAKRYPEDTRALELLAQTYETENQLAAGIRRLKEHAAAYPRSAPVQYLLGRWLQRAGSLSEARHAFAAAKQANSSFWQADLAIARVHLAENKVNDARFVLTPLLDHPQAAPQARLLLASAAEKSGARTEAVGHYRRILEQEPDHVFALNNLAYLLAEHVNSPDEALRFAQRAQELAPDDPTVNDTIGWVYFRKGVYDSAIQYMESSVKRQPNATRHAHLAIAYAKRGDRNRAMEHVSAAVRMSPRVPEVIEARRIVLGGE
jgi:tetratricopeptide (TPR) repeat protein